MCIINLISVILSCLAALWLLRDIDAYINKRWAMQVQDLIHKLTNSLNAQDALNMQKMHKYMQKMQNNNSNHDEFCCYHFIDGYQTYTQFKTQQPHCQQRCLPWKQVKDQHVLFQVHWKRFAFYIPHPHLWNPTKLYSGQTVSSSVAQYQHISVQCYRDTWCMNTSLIYLTSCMHE